MQRPHLEISPGIQARMDYPKMASESVRMLVLESHYWVDQACMRAAKALGWEVARTPVVMQGQMPREMVAALINTLMDFQPDFILTANLSGMDSAGLFAGLFSDLNVPYVAWFVDDPRTILMGKEVYGSDYAVAASWEAAYLPYLKNCGFEEQLVLPLAVDPSLFHGSPLQDAAGPPAFVGNSMRSFTAREWEWLRDKPELEAHLVDAFAQGQVTRENFGLGMEAVLGADYYATLDAEAIRHAEMVCFIEGTRRLREGLVRALEAKGLLVYGDSDWQEVTAHLGPWLDYTNDLPQHYRQSCVNLNSTSIQMATTVNQRVFDCPAAGGFLLTDAQAALSDLLEPEVEMATYASLEEAKEKLGYYRKHPEARIAMIEKAQTRIAAEHTYVHRLQGLAKQIKKTFA